MIRIYVNHAWVPNSVAQRRRLCDEIEVRKFEIVFGKHLCTSYLVKYLHHCKYTLRKFLTLLFICCFFQLFLITFQENAPFRHFITLELGISQLSHMWLTCLYVPIEFHRKQPKNRKQKVILLNKMNSIS